MHTPYWTAYGERTAIGCEKLIAIEQRDFGVVCEVRDIEGESVFRILRAVNDAKAQQAKIDALVESLAAILIRCKGTLGANPYTVAEYRHALEVLAEHVGEHDPYAIDLYSLRNLTQAAV